ncbi:GLPGLI family protein [Flavobacterium cerinum]|uniref:GLPGLI family protein n=1 Tax=Flavobacterium cerinum TaxID=2502784 RepID=A0A3S3U5H5_9FLAO|nr:GLPGLI family protein [Flavobacterium cerinum]RWX03696.1 GLPGLI family protein [Flavobacterium cerinum]
MKKYVIYVALLAVFSGRAQDFQGIATYESKTQMGEFEAEGGNITPEIAAMVKEQLSKSFEKKYTLRFNKTASIYDEEKQLSNGGGGGMDMQINFAGGGKQYKNLKDKVFITETEIYDKEFLIKDSLSKLEWKLENETKKIGNYTCYKATIKIDKKPDTPDEDGKAAKAINILGATNKDIIITAWYTPEIPVSQGPGEYWGLPGLILEVNDGSTSVLCSKIVLNPKEKIEITVPKKGKKVTQTEFAKILEEKTNDMMKMEEGGSDDNKMIIKIGG